MKKTALVTGASGQDAAYLIELLLQKGYEVYAGMRRTASMNLWRLKELSLVTESEYEEHNPAQGLTFLNFDVTCSAQVNNVIDEGQFDEVYNLAAMSFVPESFASPVATFQINAVGALNIMAAINQFSPSTRLYQASTSEMFGLVNVESQGEDTPFHPRSPYAVAKVAAHYAVQNYREAYENFFCSGILFNHESPLRGEEFVTRKITKAVARIVAGKQQFLELGNLDAYRDWGHARDYVYAMYLMLQQDEPEDFVIATGEKHRVWDVVHTAFTYVGIDVWAEHLMKNPDLMRPSEVPLLLGNPAKAQDKLGWKRAYDFETMIREMVDYDLSREGVDPIIYHAQLA